MDDYKLVDVIYNRDSNESSAVQFNRALHSLATNVMVSFNISEERFEEVQLPMPLPFEGMIGLLKGCLCIFGRNEKKRREVWAMQDHGVSESWTKLKIIRLFKNVSMNFIGSLNNGESPFKDRITRDIYSYDLEYETAGKGKIRGFMVEGTVSYNESLVSLNSSAAVATSGKTEITRKSKKKKTKKRKR
ncbi:uncharacterized protein LOC113304948 [Papaver somniferum]|uniref:uncharacterized protein LOC113304948 n=1 Tax=Papaver somniferum TaxID=3469 RepID=UPI000E6F91D4|nr:uncharacterized protein LOC113304948 [Papaver somniferum]